MDTSEVTSNTNNKDIFNEQNSGPKDESASEKTQNIVPRTQGKNCRRIAGMRECPDHRQFGQDR